MAQVFRTVEVNKRLFNLIRALPDEIERALIAESTDVLSAAKELTPIDTGDLKASGMVTSMEAMGSHTTEVGISFGSFGPSNRYALFVHENTNARHHPPYGKGGEAKFLETAVNRAKSGMLQRLGSRIKLERML